MNKTINIFLLIITFPAMLLTIFVGFNLPIEFLKVSGENLPYKEQTFLIIGAIIFVLILRRLVKRWMGARIVSKVQRFKWNSLVGEKRSKRVVSYTLIEALIMISIGLGLYRISNEALPITLAFAFGTLDNLVYTIIGKSKNLFRIGLSSKALILADREVILVYFTGLRKVSKQQDSFYFDYIKGLQLSFPIDAIPPSKLEGFKSELEKVIDSNKVFYDVD